MGDNKKVRPKRILPSCPAKQDPMGVIAAERRAGTNILEPGEAPPPDMILGRRNVDAFWGALPWGDAQTFFSRDRWVNAPAIGALDQQFETFTVPSGLILAITSVIFRAKLEAEEGGVGAAATFARDDFFSGFHINTGAIAFFNPKLSGRAMTSRTYVSNANFERSGFSTLNQNIADSQVPFVVFAKENQAVSCDITALAGGAHIWDQVEEIGVEWEGMLMPSQLYDKLRREFHA